VKNIFLGLAMVLSLTLGTQTIVQADHAVFLGDRHHVIIPCKGEEGKLAIDRIVLDFVENVQFSENLDQAFMNDYCRKMPRALIGTAMELFSTHKDSDGDWMTVVRISPDEAPNIFYTIFWSNLYWS